MVNNKFLLGSLLIVVILLGLSFASAGLGDWFRQITGRATGTHAANVTITGLNNVTVSVWNNTLTGAAVDPSAGTINGISFIVTLTDADGSADINTTSVSANFTKTGEGLRQNLSCPQTGSAFGNSINFTCNISMWYFDASGTWTITAVGRDLGAGNVKQNTTQVFAYGSLNSIALSPTAINFGTVAQGATNVTATNDPSQLNNTGNVNFTQVNVTAINLYGETIDTTQFINVGNMSVSNNTGGSCTGGDCVECGPPSGPLPAATLVNGTTVNVFNTTLTRGNLSIGSGTAQEQIYYCFRTIPSSGLSSQPYSTALGPSWTITTSA